MLNLTIEVRDVTCGGGTADVQRPLGYFDGVRRVVVTFGPSSPTEGCGPYRVTPETFASTIAGLGLKPAARRPTRRETSCLRSRPNALTAIGWNFESGQVCRL